MLVCPYQEFFRETFDANDEIKQDGMSGTRLKQGRDENTDFC